MQDAWGRIGRAVDYYVQQGFQYWEAPWMLSGWSGVSAYYTTKSPGAIDVAHSYRCLEGRVGKSEFLVASGEQSFLQAMMEERLPTGRLVCATPCFRHEPDNSDGLHLPYFLKVELIYTGDHLLDEGERRKQRRGEW
jgi:seryl-tRNA synthetase